MAKVVVQHHGAHPQLGGGFGSTDQRCERRHDVIEVVGGDQQREAKTRRLACLVLPLDPAADGGGLETEAEWMVTAPSCPERPHGHRLARPSRTP